MCRSACGSSQPEVLSIQFTSSDTTLPPPATSKPTKKRKEPTKPSAKKAKATGMKKEKGLVTPNSPAMCTRSKTPESPAMGTRSKRKILD